MKLHDHRYKSAKDALKFKILLILIAVRFTNFCHPHHRIMTHFWPLYRAVFFNLFAAVEPYKSVKVTHGTPCSDPWVQRRMRGWSYRVSTDSFP